MKKLVIVLIIMVLRFMLFSQSLQFDYKKALDELTVIEFFSALNATVRNSNNAINTEFIATDSIVMLDTLYVFSKSATINDFIEGKANDIITDTIVTRTRKSFIKNDYHSFEYFYNNKLIKGCVPREMKENIYENNEIKKDGITYQFFENKLLSVAVNNKLFSYLYDTQDKLIEIKEQNTSNMNTYLYSFEKMDNMDSVVTSTQEYNGKEALLGKEIIKQPIFDPQNYVYRSEISEYSFLVSIDGENDTTVKHYLMEWDTLIDNNSVQVQINKKKYEQGINNYIPEKSITEEIIYDNNGSIKRIIKSVEKSELNIIETIEYAPIDNNRIVKTTSTKAFFYNNPIPDTYHIATLNERGRFLDEIYIEGNDTLLLKKYQYSSNNRLIKETGFIKENGGAIIRKISRDYYYEIFINEFSFERNHSKIFCNITLSDSIKKLPIEFDNKLNLDKISIKSTTLSKEHINYIAVNEQRNKIQIAIYNEVFENSLFQGKNTVSISIDDIIEGVAENHKMLFDCNFTFYRDSIYKDITGQNNEVSFKVYGTTGKVDVECDAGISEITVSNMQGLTILHAKPDGILLFSFSISEYENNKTYAVTVISGEGLLQSRLIFLQ